ncbi:hypothetical protein J5N97_025200 [Dioscorea zingiberensis]|uniref:Bax inhibitor 1 n=1 Tax=Dioscorea zingiberensis TaxID=325984 RepID=A0A9D5H9S7_9LILI|nr:hypothetical protein J5N97_025200 [Dioscorea zingiberensis]
MDYFQSTYPSSGRRSAEAFFKDSLSISPLVQRHLKLVYLTLCCALAASALGVYLDMLFKIGGLLTLFGCLFTLFWLMSTPPHHERKKFGLLMVAALLEGSVVGPLINLAIKVDPSMVLTAFVGTSIAFGCFTAAAIVAKRREFLYLGGLLSSALSLLIWFRMASLFFFSQLSMSVELYFGLLIFLGYIVYDTQHIIEKAHSGDFDFVGHALILFTDFVAVFVRILRLMLEKSEHKSKREKQKKRT